MSWFYNLSTMKKLILGFSLVCVVMAVVGYVGVTGMGEIDDMMNRLYSRDLVGVSNAKEMNVKLMYIARSFRNALLTTDKAAIEKQQKDAEKYDGELREILKKVEQATSGQEMKEAVAKANEAYPKYMETVRQAMTLSLQGKNAEAKDVLTAGGAAVAQVVEALTTLAKLSEKQAEQEIGRASAAYASLRTTLVVVILAGVIGALTLGCFIARMIAKPLGQAVGVCEAVANGDFSKRLKVDSKDEVGRMAGALNQCIDATVKMMDDIKRGVAPTEAFQKNTGKYGRFDEAVAKLDPRKE